jgi:glycyl-tRNA synthetase beta chain
LDTIALLIYWSVILSSATFLLEIGVEELPALPLLKILNKIEKSWGEILKEYRVECDYSFDYTPRRLSIRSDNFPLMQQDKIEELFGPPLSIAYKDGNPTQAALGFAKKCGVDIEKLSTTTKGKNEVLYYKKEQKGIQSSKLIEEMATKWLKGMEFGKMMRWGEHGEEFIRPIRWIVALLDNKIVDIELFNVKSSNSTRLHRMSEPAIKEVTYESYEDILNSGNVILDAKRREEIVVEQIKEIENKSGIEVELDKDLLAEVVAITENPTALLGSFDEKFLELPPEVIITSMKEHQRYFGVFKNGTLANNFVVVSNAVTDDFSKIISGNEKVLRPRLEDALFFYKNDLKRGLKTDGLELVQFIDGLGSLKDKIEREAKIAKMLYSLYKDRLDSQYPNKDIEALLNRAVNLAKADLMSEMVYEFTELQGLMGYYYAKALGEDELVYNTIKEQYMPTGDNAELPSNLFSTLVSIAIKLDTLYGLFSVGKIPTGSKDPFALRRAVNGVARMVVANDIDFDLDTIFAKLAPMYKEFNTNLLKEFIFERIYKLAKVNPSVVTAVLSSGDSNLNTIFKKIDALNSIVEQSNSKELFVTFKRVANISKDLDLSSNLEVNEALFEKEQERSLYQEFIDIKNSHFDSYKAKLDALFSLKDRLDSFFDNVLVNANDNAIKQNRQNLIGQIYKEFRDIADIKEVTV